MGRNSVDDQRGEVRGDIYTECIINNDTFPTESCTYHSVGDRETVPGTRSRDFRCFVHSFQSEDNKGIIIYFFVVFIAHRLSNPFIWR